MQQVHLYRWLLHCLGWQPHFYRWQLHCLGWQPHFCRWLLHCQKITASVLRMTATVVKIIGVLLRGWLQCFPGMAAALRTTSLLWLTAALQRMTATLLIVTAANFNDVLHAMPAPCVVCSKTVLCRLTPWMHRSWVLHSQVLLQQTRISTCYYTSVSCQINWTSQALCFTELVYQPSQWMHTSIVLNWCLYHCIEEELQHNYWVSWWTTRTDNKARNKIGWNRSHAQWTALNVLAGISGTTHPGGRQRYDASGTTHPGGRQWYDPFWRTPAVRRQRYDPSRRTPAVRPILEDASGTTHPGGRQRYAPILQRYAPSGRTPAVRPTLEDTSGTTHPGGPYRRLSAWRLMFLVDTGRWRRSAVRLKNWRITLEGYTHNIKQHSLFVVGWPKLYNPSMI